MKNYAYIIIILILQACTSSDGYEDQESEGFETQRCIDDKRHIEQAFINNVESVRRYLSYKDKSYYMDSLENKCIPNNIPEYSSSIFIQYAIYWNERANDSYAFPTPACEWLDVEVEHIAYSSDSLKCVVLLTVTDNGMCSVIKGKAKKVEYDGYAMACIRDKITEPFKIYPMGVVSFYFFPSREQTARILKNEYFNLKGSYCPNSGVAYTCGINNPDFFNTAHDFSRLDSLNLYWCETEFAMGGRRVPLVFYSNQDSTINKNLCE